MKSVAIKWQIAKKSEYFCKALNILLRIKWKMCGKGAVWCWLMFFWTDHVISPPSILPAVGSGTPATVRFGHQPSPQHELLVFLHDGSVSQDHLDVMGVEALRALGAGDVDTGLGDLNAQVLAQAVCAGAVVAGHDVREAIPGVAKQAQRAFQQVWQRPRPCRRGRHIRRRLDGDFVDASLGLRAFDADDAVCSGRQSPGFPLGVPFGSESASEEWVEGQTPLFRILSNRGEAYGGRSRVQVSLWACAAMLQAAHCARSDARCYRCFS